MRYKLLALVLLIGVPACNDVPTQPTTITLDPALTGTNANSASNNNNTTITINFPQPLPGPTNPNPTNPNPNQGQLPTYGESVVRSIAASNPSLVANSCVTTNPSTGYAFLDQVVAQLRTMDVRWGYTCSTSGCGQISPDTIAYYGGSDPVFTSGAKGIHIVDIIESYCLNPQVGYLVQGFFSDRQWKFPR